MERLLRIALTRFMRTGNLRVSVGDGKPLEFGDGSGTPVAMRFASARALARIFLNPELRLGEAYMNGGFVLEAGTIADLLALLMSQTPHYKVPYFARPQAMLRFGRRRIDQFNNRTRARQNVAHHYDLDARLYSLFLDADRQYSCAYFENPDQTLDDAQLAKKRHLAAKLLIEDGQRVLDIGSGWGGLALYLADYCGAKVTGVTLSQEQFKLAQGRAAEAGLSNSIEFRLQDYRDLNERFDRIVSVGMFEHVGVGHYHTFFDQCAKLLSDDGIMVLHSIGRSEGPNATNPWIDKYIFPGGYIPALSEVLPAIERAGLIVSDVEILRLHYAETLKAWRERFMARADEARRLYDDRFVRMWEFYLAASEMAFRHQGMMVFQIQLAKRVDAVPITRNYIEREEQRLRGRERMRVPPLQLAGE
ncbi:cyclopropane-fatty-acyl-phospholipid synthase family protein [Pseudorhodoplanes sp.]|uniref:cyclopropane-fatty-acyl-phospholipid synthase family protein n=1 Tax=Pseudorhodoplanes sp. TaxID=1934341 RepID=UPI002D0D4E82|nr:cyclopropane-fatty-acyl-phospholipid synthase family protein [Pseudorhodoplanes sp.]HWV52262.1 cyclopropane-fatty-acyl-phospholipid synthase family protein [Pseudorhodoplanes sp.]